MLKKKKQKKTFNAKTFVQAIHMYFQLVLTC